MGKSLYPTSKQELKREKVKTLLKARVPIQKIPKQTRVSLKTVERLQNRRAQRKAGSGRKEVLGRSSKIRIINAISSNPFLTPADLVERLNLNCSPETVRKYLIESGRSYRLPNRKEPLTEEQKRERLNWCLDRQDFEYFEDVIFTDEAGIWLNDRKGKGWFPNHMLVRPVDIESREKINIWGAISCAGKIGLYVFRDNFNSLIYEQAVKEVLVPVAQELHPEGCYLQRDNSKVHRAKHLNKFFRSAESDIILETITWPSYSPDLNPIENLWAVLKRKIRKRRPRNLDQLEDFIFEEWEDISDDYVRNLCFSINDRIDMCIENEGSRINY